MHLKIYILKKKQIIWSAVILAVVVLAIIVFFSIRAAQTINILSVPNSFKADINNDGKVDSVVIKSDSPTKDYSVSVICSDENGYELSPDSVIKTFGKADTHSPLNITFKDIDNDSQDELFIQSSDKNGPILHVFKYRNNNIERIASGRYFMYGHISNPTTKDNILVLASRKEGIIKYSYLKSENGNLAPYTADSSLNLCLGKLSDVVGMIENDDVKTVSLSLDKSTKNVLSKGTMLDGIISDVELADYDTPVKCTYLIRTGVSSDPKQAQALKKYKIEMAMSNADSEIPDYSITNIEEIN